MRGWRSPSWIYICTSLVSLADLVATQDCQKTKGRSYLPRTFTLCMRINFIHSASEAERLWELFRVGKGERLVITFLDLHLYILAFLGCRNCEIHSLPVTACWDVSGWECSFTEICVILHSCRKICDLHVRLLNLVFLLGKFFVPALFWSSRFVCYVLYYVIPIIN